MVGRPTHDELQHVGEVAVCLIKQCGNIRQKSCKELFGLSSTEHSIDLLYKLLKFDPSKRLKAKEAMMHPYLKEFFKEEDLVAFKGTIAMETDENVKLTTEEYKDLIHRHFIEQSAFRTQPQRFSQIKREKSFGKILQDIHSRKSSI